MEDVRIQAPAGGAVSVVNEKFYKGGEFMPDSGLFCGIKRKAKKFAAASVNWAEITVYDCMVWARPAASTRKIFLTKDKFASTEEAAVFANEVIALRSAWYVNNGLEPHPTEIIIA